MTIRFRHLLLTTVVALTLAAPVLGQREAPPPETPADRLLAAMHRISSNTIL